MNQKLGSTARQEIRKAMQGLVGTAAKHEAGRLAAIHNISWQYIYRMTEDLRPNTRKKRSDAGKRTFELVEGTDVWYAAQLVIGGSVDPDLALLTARERGYTKLPTLEYFRQMLAGKGLGKNARRNPKVAYRKFEAEFPGEMFQIDVTALKVRWIDEKTRRIQKIEGVDKNHPQMDPTKIQVWQILLTDDHSRRKFLRYFTARAITSTEMVRFMCEAYTELGVPHKLYTDQGGEFKGRHRQAARILNSLLANDGGYRHIPHAPYNSKATGKVENGHQWAEKMDRLVGLAITEGQVVTLDTLNVFAERICTHYNNRIHRTTGQTPMVRWHGKRIVVRKLPAEIIESALLSQEFEVALDPSMTVTDNKISYKIPGVQPFVDYVGRKVLVVVPPNIDVIMLTLPNALGKFEPDNGGVFDIEKVLASADKAGEFKSVAESTAQDLTKRLKASRKEEIRSIKAQNKLTGEIAPVPHVNIEIEQPASNVSAFPHQERVVTYDEIAAVTPLVSTGIVNDRVLNSSNPKSKIQDPKSAAAYSGRNIGYWQSVAEYSDQFEGGKDEAKHFLLALFPDTAGELPAGQVESAIADRYKQPERLRAVS